MESPVGEIRSTEVVTVEVGGMVLPTITREHSTDGGGGLVPSRDCFVDPIFS